MINAILNLRRLRCNGAAEEPSYGEMPIVKFTNKPSAWVGGGILLIVSLISFFICWIIFSWVGVKNSFTLAADRGLQIGMFSMALYYISPIVYSGYFMIKHKQLPTRSMFKNLSNEQKIVLCGIFGFALVYLFNYTVEILIVLAHNNSILLTILESIYVTSVWHNVVISFVVGLCLYVIGPLLLPKKIKVRKKKNAQNGDQAQSINFPFRLWIGRSTGYLSQLWHRTGLAEGQDITLSLEDAAQNILIFGENVSEKMLMQTLLAQLVDQKCGGLLFDVKGDVKKVVLNLAECCNRNIIIIGSNKNKLNLLSGLDPEIVASFLKSTLFLNGGIRTDSFLVDATVELYRNTLGLLSFIPKSYTLQNLYHYLFDNEFRDGVKAQINTLIISLNQKEQRLLKNYLHYHDDIFPAFDEKIKSDVIAMSAQILSPFNHPDLADAFSAQTNISVDMTKLLDGTIFLVDMPLSRWGNSARVIYGLTKLHFFNMMQDRDYNQKWKQGKPIFFACDQYQDLVSVSKDGLSDLDFWDKFVSSKTIGIISLQSVSSFYAAIGNRDLANAIMQHFKQKFCFKTEDRETLAIMDSLAGQALIQRKACSNTTGMIGDYEEHTITQNIAETRETILDPQLFRQLSQGQMIGMLSVNGHSMDDLFNLFPVFDTN